MVNDMSFSTDGVRSQLEEEYCTLRTSQDGKAIAGCTFIWPPTIALSVQSLSEEQKQYIFG
jgi:hypothetical protein